MGHHGWMCTTTEEKSLLPNVQIMRTCSSVQLKGARVSDTKDHVQVSCRDGINVIRKYVKRPREYGILEPTLQLEK